MKKKIKEKKCSAKTKLHGGGILPHICGLPKNHKGKHRCRLQIEYPRGQFFKPFKKPIPCNIRWGGGKT